MQLFAKSGWSFPKSLIRVPPVPVSCRRDSAHMGGAWSRRHLRILQLYRLYSTTRPSSDGAGVGAGGVGVGGGTNDNFFGELILHIRNKNFEASMDLYKRMKVFGRPTKPMTYNSLLNVCSKAEHLPAALQLFEDMQCANIKHSEQAYLALIRCYAADGKIDTALRLIEEMEALAIEPRLRTYHPIFEAICATGNTLHALSMIRTMHSRGIFPKSEQMALLIETAAKSGALQDHETRESLDSLISTLSTELLGMQFEEMQRLVVALNKASPESVRDGGILVEAPEAIRGDVIEDKLDSEGTAIALNNEYHFPVTYFTDTSPVPTSSDTSVPIGANNASSMTTYLQKYCLARKDLTTAQQRNAMAAPACIVDIYDATSCCPNCGGELQKLFLEEDERRRVRAALTNIVSALSPGQNKSLEAFAEFLSKNDEFVYIVDGANVAYHKQNFDNGQFSYRQIDLVVNRLKERGEKILVLLPYPYARRIIPNSAKHKKGKRVTYLTKEDQCILERFEEEGMLYVVPQWANDDWYWMFATVNENRKNMAYVITNDLTRDHRLAFLEPKPFVRWRTTQVVHFDFSHAAETGAGPPDVTFIEPGTSLFLDNILRP